ncbi:MAG: hypothetical protein ACJ75B_13020 [Flavisolibacter sp.]
MNTGRSIITAVEKHISDFSHSLLKSLYDKGQGLIIKYVPSKWAVKYLVAQKLKISESPALTWGTATYVTPLIYPLSSALYGRIGLVSSYDPTNWQVFDAISASGRAAYVRWARNQPAYRDLLLTVHSTLCNHELRNKFRQDFSIDCLLFHPDQEAEFHTNKTGDIWMAVTDWTTNNEIDIGLSERLNTARFTVLIDEDFDLLDKDGLPTRVSKGKIEDATVGMMTRRFTTGIDIVSARTNINLTTMVHNAYSNSGFVHIYIMP